MFIYPALITAASSSRVSEDMGRCQRVSFSHDDDNYTITAKRGAERDNEQENVTELIAL